jgi:hypothetical protein
MLEVPPFKKETSTKPRRPELTFQILHSKNAQDRGAAITTKGAAFTTTKAGVEPISA